MIHMIPVDKIYPSPAQPRKDFDDERIIRLAESFTRYGILQPLTVRFAADPRIYSGRESLKNYQYELIAGERRLRAAKIAGFAEVPCMIAEADGRRAAEMSIVENLMREDLNLFEQAGAIGALIEVYGLTQEQTARALGMTQSSVANKLRLLRLSEREREMILENRLTERHARALLKIAAPEERIPVLEEVIRRELNVSETESLIEKRLSAADAPSPRVQRGMIRDLRIFYNTIDRAIDVMEKAGIGVAKERRESEEAVEVVIRIRKNQGSMRGAV